MKQLILDAFTAIWWTHRQVMRVRFPMLAGVLVAAIFLFVQQGREILNVLAQPAVAQSSLFRKSFGISGASPIMNWGWIGTFWAGALALSLMCWAFSRVLLGLKFNAPGGAAKRGPLIGERATTPWQEGLEDACEAVLPTVFGALPLVAIGCGLLLNAQSNMVGTPHPGWLTFFCRLWPLVVVLLVPLVVLVGDGIARANLPDPRKASPIMNGLKLSIPVALAIPVLVSVICAFALEAPRTCFQAAAFFALALTIYGLDRVRWASVAGGAIIVFTLWTAFSVAAEAGGPQPFPWKTPETWMGLLGGTFALCIPFAFVWGQEKGSMAKRFTEGGGQPEGKASELFDLKSLTKGVEQTDEFQRKQRFFTWLVLSALVYLACVIALIVSRTDLSRWAGSGAVLLLALGFWLCVLCGVQIAAQKERVPWLALLAVWATICTLGNDNHQVLVAKTEPAASTQAGLHPGNVGEAYERWRNVPAVKAAGEKGAQPPLFIVVTEGGGVRAAFWTATVLGALQDLSLKQRDDAPPGPDKLPVFVDHCFAISGVSGGSVGGAVFASMQTTQHSGATQETLDVLKEDLLSPLISGLVCNDWVQCLWFRPVQYFDRGRRFEENLEKRFSLYLGPDEKNPLMLPMLTLNHWRAENPTLWTPYLFMNATDVDEGRRVIFSDVGINTKAQEFADAESGLVRMGQKKDEPPGRVDVLLSTAAHNSARFPYTNPTGRLPDHGRVTDGGLFENSGATTGVEIARAIQGASKGAAGKLGAKIVFVVVEFGDAPQPEGRSTSQYFLHGLLGPPAALLSTRTARASYAIAALLAESPQLGTEVVRFKASTKRVTQPLGWQLSALAAREMYFQMPHEIVAGQPLNVFEADISSGRRPVEDGYDEKNRESARKILDILAGKHGP
jgi:hypothetical protein